MEKSLVDSFNIVSGDIIIIVFKMIQCIDFSSFERNCLLTRFGVEVLFRVHVLLFITCIW